MPCTLFIAQSLDAFIAGPKGEIDFLDSVSVPGEDYGYADFLKSVDVLVMGRKTWELAKSFGPWPYAGKESWVLTRHATDLKPVADEYFSGFDAAIWRDVARTKHVWLVGGGETNRLFFENDLVDRIVLSTVPVLLGSGLPCFPPSFPLSRWRLEKSLSFPSGLVENFYAKV